MLHTFRFFSYSISTLKNIKTQLVSTTLHFYNTTQVYYVKKMHAVTPTEVPAQPDCLITTVCFTQSLPHDVTLRKYKTNTIRRTEE
jgi:hypothetical protein